MRRNCVEFFFCIQEKSRKSISRLTIRLRWFIQFLAQHLVVVWYLHLRALSCFCVIESVEATAKENFVSIVTKLGFEIFDMSKRNNRMIFYHSPEVIESLQQNPIDVSCSRAQKWFVLSYFVIISWKQNKKKIVAVSVVDTRSLTKKNCYL